MAHLCSQAHGVEHNEEEHEVLKVAGGDDVPDLVLGRVLGDVAAERSSLQSVLHTLPLEEQDTNKRLTSLCLVSRKSTRVDVQCVPATINNIIEAPTN